MADWSALDIFVDVARCRSFSRAAELHGVSQSAASQRVSHLEKSLGVRLLDRSVRPLVLTDAGQVLMDGGIAVLAELQGLTRRVSAMKESHHQGKPPIRVRAIYSAGIAWLGAVRSGFEAETGRRVEVQYDAPAAVCSAMERGLADVGIVSFPGHLVDASSAACDLAWQPLREEVMCVVCPAGHAWSREPSVSARHLTHGTNGTHAGVEMLAFDTSLPVGAAVRDYLAEHGVKPAIANTFDNLDTLKAAVVGTGRPAILPRRCVQAEVASGQLAAVALRPTLTRPIAALFKPEPTQGKASRAKEPKPPAGLKDFLAYLAKHAEPEAATATLPASTATAAPPAGTTRIAGAA